MALGFVFLTTSIQWILFNTTLKLALQIHGPQLNQFPSFSLLRVSMAPAFISIQFFVRLPFY